MSSKQIQRIINEYPAPLAATYMKKLYRLVGMEEQVYQFHEGLRDVAEMIIKYLAVLVLAQYRKDTLASKENLQIENEIQKLSTPSLGHWTDLLRDTLQMYADTDLPLLREMYNFYFDEVHTDNKISQAVERLQEWLGLQPRRKPPYSYRDLFEILVIYRNRPEGWAAHGAVLAGNREYEERAAVLHPALEKALIDVEFLTQYPLIYVQSVSRQADKTWLHRLRLGMGRDVEIQAEPLRSINIYEPEHLYICSEDENGLTPFLDVHPLLTCQECKGCRNQTIFVLNLGRGDRIEYLSYSCGHRLEIQEEPQFMQSFRTFLSLEQWRGSGYVPSPVQQQTPAAIYMAAIRDVLMSRGEISPLERQTLNSVASVLSIQPAEALRLEVAARREQAAEAVNQPEKPTDTFPLAPEQPPLEIPAPPEPIEVPAVVADEASPQVGQPELSPAASLKPAESSVTQAKPVLQNADEAPNSISENGELTREMPPSQASQQKLVLCWTDPVESTIVGAALFGSPVHVFTADEKGNVTVYTQTCDVSYRDHLGGRIFRTAVWHDRVLAGTWEGQLYCFGCNEFLWHVELGGPISALATSQGDIEIAAGTWDGQVVVHRANGHQIWEARLEDGVSSLAINSTGDLLVAGSYDGRLSILDAAGRKLWARDMQKGIVRVLFTNYARDLLVLTQEHMVARISVENQEIRWEKSLGSIPVDLSLSANDRRLAIATNEDHVELYSINGTMDLRTAYEIASLSGVVISPLSPDGHYILGVSRQHGLRLIDNRRMVISVESENPVSIAALSADGYYVLEGGQHAVTLYRLAQPQIKATLTPVAPLQKGRFTRLTLDLYNSGERTAREIEILLDGAFDYSKLSPPQTLNPGKSFSSQDQSIQPRADGALPVYVRISYMDDLGIQHSSETTCMLDVLPGE